MGPFHHRLVQVALAAGEPYGFCLAGGYAVQAHGFIERRSDDVDLFTTSAIEDAFPAAVQAIAEALRADGLTVVVTREGGTFARLEVSDRGNGASSSIDLGVDWRAYPPTQLELGPVLHADDAVANKLSALFGRGAVRDYIDVDGVIRSGRYTLPQLMELAVQHDPGFDVPMFADALRAIERLSASAFGPYGLTLDEVRALMARTVACANELLDEGE